MRILFHLNSMGHGGAERCVSILCNFFAKKGHHVILATEWKSPKEYTIDANVHRVHVGLDAADDKKGRIAKIWLRYARLRSCIKKQRPDIVISFCNKANFRSATAMLGMKIPLLVSVRNDPQKDYAPYKISTKIMEQKAAGCVFQTPDARAFFSQKLQDKSKIILNPLAQQYFEFLQYKSITREKEIVTVGRITAQKNQMLLLKVFDKVCKTFPEYTLKIYGAVEDQQIFEKMKHFLASRGLENRVLFMGEVDNIQEQMINAALFVLPSDYEGMPNALIEAMVLGIPCIATDCPCGGSAMLIENQKSGILVRPGDQKALEQAVRYMLSQPDKAEQMGNQARLLADRVDPKKICEEWMEYIEQLIKK